MKMTRVTSVAVLLIFAVAYGEALKCYVGGQSGITEQDCAGSCVTTETPSRQDNEAPQIAKEFAYSCSQTSNTGPCLEVAGSNVCYCNTDLCNTGGCQCGGGGGGGGTTMKPSGSSALVGTWTVTCLVAIATAAGRVIF